MAIENEVTLRPALVAQLRQLVALDDDCVLVEELGVEHGAARIDLAALGSSVYGFEIKAAADTLGRLDRQVSYYEKLVDYAYLVATDKHATMAMQRLPLHWGVILAEKSGEGIAFSAIRGAMQNPNRDAESLVRLLWRGEALAALVALGLDRGVRRKSARILHSRLAGAVELEKLGTLVLDCIRQRSSWGLRQRKPMSLGALGTTTGSLVAT